MAKNFQFENPYTVLNVSEKATAEELRKSFSSLVLKTHPDRATGSAEEFQKVTQAYEILMDPRKRRIFDQYGIEALQADADDLLRLDFGGSDAVTVLEEKRRLQAQVDELQKKNDDLQRQIVLREPEGQNMGGESAFQAYLRNLNPEATGTITSDSIADMYGVTKSSYTPLDLPPLQSYVIRQTSVGEPQEVLRISREELPRSLEWGEVLVMMMVSPISPKDLRLARWFHIPEHELPHIPTIVGTEGIGIVIAIGPGCRRLVPGDWVTPSTTIAGTWRALGVIREKHLVAIRTTCSPQQAVHVRALCVAYRLLQNFGEVRTGDTIIQSGATGLIGRTMIQLCRVLGIKTINIVRERSKFDETRDELKRLGADFVLVEGALKTKLRRVGADTPRLALDCVGGEITQQLADCLRPNSTLVIYGTASNDIPQLPIRATMFRGITVSGFWFDDWVDENEDSLNAKTGLQDMLLVMFPLLEQGRVHHDSIIHRLGGDNSESVFQAALQTAESLRDSPDNRTPLLIPVVLLQWAVPDDAETLMMKLQQFYENRASGKPDIAIQAPVSKPTIVTPESNDEEDEIDSQKHQFLEFLKTNGLIEYAEKLANDGFETLDDFVTLTESDLDDIGMKKGHKRRLLSAISSLKITE